MTPEPTLTSCDRREAHARHTTSYAPFVVCPGVAYSLDWLLAHSLGAWDAMSGEERADFPSYAHFVLSWSSGALENMRADGEVTREQAVALDREVHRYVYDELMTRARREAES